MAPPAQFHEAAKAGDVDTMQSLIKEHESIDFIASRSGGIMNNSALHWAAAAGHEAATQFLIESGANVNEKNGLEDTPLHSAAWRGWESTCSLLLSAGADPRAENKEGKTPHQLAKNHGDKLVSLLPRFRASSLTSLEAPSSDEEEDDDE